MNKQTTTQGNRRSPRLWALALVAGSAFSADLKDDKGRVVAQTLESTFDAPAKFSVKSDLVTPQITFKPSSDVIFFGSTAHAWLTVSPISTKGDQTTWYDAKNIVVKVTREPVVTKTKDGWEIIFR
jgi:hypothetical protein